MNDSKKYDDVLGFRDALVEYLETQKTLYSEDIERNKNLPDEEKIEEGLLIADVALERTDENDIIVSFEENNTKLRPGDKVLLVNKPLREKIEAMVIENLSNSMTLECSTLPQGDSNYRIEVLEYVMLDPLIQLLSELESGMPGMFFLKVLADQAAPKSPSLSDNHPNLTGTVANKLNSEQLNICNNILGKPSAYCVQGPPGTGKTNVLAVSSAAFSMNREDILIIAKTHQAVNNALTKVAEKAPYAHVVKIGPKIKAPDATTGVKCFRKFRDYQSFRRQSKPYFGDIVGITLQTAIVNLGIQNKGFVPEVTLVDEASQIQMAEASVIGTFGSRSVIFIGDDKQMPPIFHEEQKHDPFSISVFSRLINQYPRLEGKLRVTYRMNQELTEFISSRYYEPYGEKLIPSDFSKDRRLEMKIEGEDSIEKKILEQPESIVHVNISKNDTSEDRNTEESLFVASLIKKYLESGGSTDSIAVITPFRKQVLAIREAVCESIDDEIPIIDTVERLQGQDVDVIILSFAVTSQYYYHTVREFLLDKNRLNVMLSRAKKKAIVLCNDEIWEEILNQ